MKENRNAWLGSPTVSMILVRVAGTRRRIDLFGPKLQAALIDVSLRSFCAAHRDLLACSKSLRGIAGADDARDTELSRDNRRMRRSATLIGYDRPQPGASPAPSPGRCFEPPGLRHPERSQLGYITHNADKARRQSFRPRLGPIPALFRAYPSAGRQKLRRFEASLSGLSPGRAWTMNNSPVMPSFAHSMSIGCAWPGDLRIVFFDQAGPAASVMTSVVGQTETHAVLGWEWLRYGSCEYLARTPTGPLCFPAAGR